MAIPDSLSDTIDLFRATGRFNIADADFFRASSWLAMFAGFGVVPDYYHPAVDDIPEGDLIKELQNMAEGITNAVQGAPTHQAFIEANVSRTPS